MQSSPPIFPPPPLTPPPDSAGVLPPPVGPTNPPPLASVFPYPQDPPAPPHFIERRVRMKFGRWWFDGRGHRRPNSPPSSSWRNSPPSSRPPPNAVILPHPAQTAGDPLRRSPRLSPGQALLSHDLSPATTLKPTMGTWVSHPRPADSLAGANSRASIASSPTQIPTPILRGGGVSKRLFPRCCIQEERLWSLSPILPTVAIPAPWGGQELRLPPT